MTKTFLAAESNFLGCQPVAVSRKHRWRPPLGLAGRLIRLGMVCVVLAMQLLAADVGAAVDPSGLAQALLAATTPESRAAKVLELRAQLTPMVATALRRETKLRCQRGDLPGARAAVECVVAVAGVLDAPSVEAEGHLAAGIVLAREGEHVRAVARYEQALRLATSAHDTALELEARTQLGRSGLHLGDFDRALAEYRRCLEVGEARNDQAAQARALHNLGEALRQRGQLRQALEHFEAALERQGSAVAATEIADTRLGRAGVFVELGEPDDALREYLQVLEMYRQIGDEEGAGIVLGNLGVVCEMTARYEEALRHYEESLAIKASVGDTPGRVLTLNNLGVLWLMAGDYEAALDYFRQSLDLAEQTADFAGRARALNNLGETLVQTGRFFEAFRALDQSLGLYREAGDGVSAAEVQGGIATLKKAMGDYRGALAAFGSILPVFQVEGRKHDVATTLHNLGGVQQSLGRRREAVELLEASLKLRQELGDRQGEAMTRNVLGEVALRAGDFEGARGHYAESLGIARDIHARVEEVRALLGLGEVELRLGRTTEALRRFREGAEAAAPLADVALHVETSQRMGDAHRAEAKWAEAVEDYSRAIGRIEGLRFAISGASHRVSFLEQYAPAYQRRAACLVKLDRVAEAWQTAEACKARELADTLAGGRERLQPALTGEERSRVRELEHRVRLARLEQSTLEGQAPVEPARLKAVAGRLEPAMEALEAFEKELQLRHPSTGVPRSLPSGSVGPPPAVPVTDEPAVFLEFFVGEASTLLFVLLSGAAAPDAVAPTPSVFELEVSSADLTSLVRNLRNRLENRWLSLPLPESRRLYDVLIAPARELLAGRRLVCVVPDGVLWEVPFQALCDAAGRYVIQDHAVAYVPSIRALDALRDRRRERDREEADGTPAEWNLLVMANPDLGEATKAANPLLGEPVAIPGTEEQGRRIAAMFAGRSRLCVGADATEQRARELAPRHRVLHFATHGIFEADSPMFSGIRLARAADDDGYWEAREILQTELNADLVVLSACETARGELRQGEGIWGLSWALMTAGSRANLLSQWAVADQSTAELMTAFYRHWQNPGGSIEVAKATKAEALRRAQLEMIEGRGTGGRKHAHPFHWAPFILIGDWR